jgi:hypothetical protein
MAASSLIRSKLAAAAGVIPDSPRRSQSASSKSQHATTSGPFFSKVLVRMLRSNGT